MKKTLIFHLALILSLSVATCYQSQATHRKAPAHPAGELIVPPSTDVP